MALSDFCWRTVAQDIAQRQTREVEERDRELAERVAAATLEQLTLKLDQDFETLKDHMPSAAKEAHEAKLDMMYLGQRQKKLGLFRNKSKSVQVWA